MGRPILGETKLPVELLSAVNWGVLERITSEILSRIRSLLKLSNSSEKLEIEGLFWSV